MSSPAALAEVVLKKPRAFVFYLETMQEYYFSLTHLLTLIQPNVIFFPLA